MIRQQQQQSIHQLDRVTSGVLPLEKDSSVANELLSPSTKQNKVSVARSHSPDNEPTANEPRTNISPRRKAIGIINGFGFNVPFAKKGVSVQDDAKLEEVIFKKKEGTETLVWKTKLDKSPVRALNVSSVGVS